MASQSYASFPYSIKCGTLDRREWQWNNDADVEGPRFISSIQRCSSCTDIRTGIITAKWGLLVGWRRGGPAGSAQGSLQRREDRRGEERRGRTEVAKGGKWGGRVGRKTRRGRSVSRQKERGREDKESEKVCAGHATRPCLCYKMAAAQQTFNHLDDDTPTLSSDTNIAPKWKTRWHL